MHALQARQQRRDGLSRRLVHPAAHLARQRKEATALASRFDRAHRSQLTAATGALREHCRRLAWLLKKPLPQRARLALLQEAMRRAAAARLDRGRAQAAALERGLAHLNPRAVQERGYAIVTNADGSIVYDAATLNIGDEVALAFARGDAGARITRGG